MKTLKYCPELNTFTGSITASLLMCQLEYWFHHTKGEAFYKFLEPCKDPHYHTGDSWIEEIGFTKAEFRTAFKHIGTVYKSKTEFLKSKDPFAGKLYLSYYDRIKKLTYYLRNNAQAPALLRHLESVLPYSLDYLSTKDYTQKSFSKTETDASYPHILHLFHTNCPSLTPVSKLSPKCEKRLASLCMQITSKGLDLLPTLEKVFKMVEQSDFLCGRGHFRKWRAFFSWIIRPDKFFAILEGAYLPFQPVLTPTSPTTCVPSNPSTKPPHKFMRMYTYNFDIQALEAQEAAYLDSLYGPLSGS